MRIKEKLGSAMGKDVLVTLVAQLSIMVIALLINKVLSLRLGVEGYGTYSIIKKSTQVLSFMMLCGMGIALPRYMAGFLAQEAWTKAKATWVVSLVLVGMVSVVVLSLTWLLYTVLHPWVTGIDDTALYGAALLYALSLTAASWLFAYYRGVNAFLSFGVSQVAVQLLLLGLALLPGISLLSLFNAWSLATLGYVLVSMVVESRRQLPWSGARVGWSSSLKPQLKVLATYGLPRMGGDFFYFSLAAFPLVYINGVVGVTETAYFATGLMLTSMVTPLFGFLGMVLLPYVSSAMATKAFERVDRLIGRLLLIYLGLSVLATLCFWLGMHPLIRFFFSAAFLPSVQVASILAAGIVFEAVYLLLRNPIDAVSAFPYNTINLLLSFLLLVASFTMVNTLVGFAYVFVGVTAFKALFSVLTWQYCRKRYLIHG